MENADLRELRGLVERIQRGACVLILGPRVAVDPADPERHPLDELLAGELLKAVQAPAEEVAQCGTNLHRAADHYVRMQGDPYMLTTFARDFYKPRAGKITDFHRDLARLPFRLCIDASPDDLMTSAFAELGKTPQRGHYDYTGGPMPPLSEPSIQKPIVYHLFGHYEEPASLVLTEADLIKFLVAVTRTVPPLPDQIRSILNNPSVSCLFLGFGFHQWYLRVLLEVLNLYKSSKGLAYEDRTFFERPDREETVGFFSGSRRIDFRPLQWEAFAKDLADAYEANAPREPTDRTPFEPQGPVAFVSYASEDRQLVDGLREQLETRGIRVWQDKQDLRAGEKWPRALKDVIDKQVQYVIVVQTAAMLERPEGVYNMEIELALARQSNMRPPLRFIIPVRFGGCAILPTLTEYHVIDVSADGGVDELARSIHEDWQRRARAPVKATA